MTDVNVQDVWKKAIDEQSARAESAWAELGKLESRGADQARSMVDEWAKLTRESIAYGAELHAEWRKATMDATKRAFAMVPGAK